jgi:exodeoxyribonuclease-3
MKIIAWNVNGIRACAQKGLAEFMKEEDPDIFCLQETKCHPDQLDEELKALHNYKSYWSSAKKKGYSGTVTYTRKPTEKVEYGIGDDSYDSEGRFVITHHPKFTLYNVYFPNGGASEERHNFKQKFLADFTKHLKAKIKQGENLIVVGDYNVAHTEIDIHDPVRLSTESGFLPEEREWMSGFLNSGFIDTFRHFHPGVEDRYTWWSYRQMARVNNRGWRIDYICVTEGLKKYLKSAEILDAQNGSDHCPVVLELEGL